MAQQSHAGDARNSGLVLCCHGLRAPLMAGAQHYTHLEGVDRTMSVQGIDEFMQPVIALPDRLNAGLPIALAGSEAPELR